MEEEQVLRRSVPYSLEAEQSVIGSVLLDNEVLPLACDVLVPEDFYDRRCQHIYRAVLELYRESSPVDLVTLRDKLTAMGAHEDVRSTEVLSGILNTVPTSANIENYVRIVRDKSYTRRLIHLAEETVERGYQDSVGSSELLGNAEAEVFNLTQKYNSEDQENRSIGDIVMDTLEAIEKAAEAGGSVTGVPTGFKDLDYKIAGLQPSELILIAARPSMGKTAFALNIAEYVAIKKKIPTVIFSLEMSADLLTKRLISQISHVDAQKIRIGDLSIDEWGKVAEAGRDIAGSKLFIEDAGGVTLSKLRTRLRRLKSQEDIKVVFIDYLQLMIGEGRVNSRQEEISNISRGLKAIAREIQCPIVALSQLSRAPEARNDKRPMLSDLRESGAIEQDADVVMFLYRDEYYTKDASEQKGITEVIIGKQRNGPTCTVKLRWLGELTKFANLEHEKK